MTRIRPPGSGFAGLFSQRVGLTIQRLNNYVADPNPKNVHDVRTSIRRFKAACSVMPKPLRRKKRTREFAKECDAFFRAIGRVRDYDIVLEKLDGYGLTDDGFARYVEGRRTKRIDGAAADGARRLLNLAAPSVLPDPQELSKINDRFRKKCDRLASQVGEGLNAVAGGSADPGELHDLRLASKDLRYLLEMQPGGGLAMESIRALQQTLGNIHDSDMFVRYVLKKSKRRPVLWPLVAAEHEYRSGELAKLAGALCGRT